MFIPLKNIFTLQPTAVYQKEHEGVQIIKKVLKIVMSGNLLLWGAIQFK